MVAGATAFFRPGKLLTEDFQPGDFGKVPRKSEEAVLALAAQGVADEGVPFFNIAEVMGRRLGVPVRSKSFPEAFLQMGWMAIMAQIDSPASSLQTQAVLGWAPTRPTPLEDLEKGSYFK